MSEMKRYPIDSDSLEECRVRVSFHFRKLQREMNLIVRVNVAQYLAEATASLVLLEAEEALKIAM